jgi:hypothetical protein
VISLPRRTASPTDKECGTRDGFYAAKFWLPPKKEGLDALTSRPKCRCLVLSSGDGEPPHQMQMSRPPPDADSVTHSGKICGSPRFALFHSEPKQKESGNAPRCLGKKQRPQQQARAKYRTVVKPDRGENTRENVGRPKRPPERRPRFDPKSIRPVQQRSSGLFVTLLCQTQSFACVALWGADTILDQNLGGLLQMPYRILNAQYGRRHLCF